MSDYPPMGRSRKPIDPDKLENLMQFNPTLKDTANFFQCNESTIAAFISEGYGLTFSEFRDQRLAKIKFSLIQTAIQRAQKNSNTMLIFALKNLCGWSDKADITVQQDQPFVLSYDTNVLKKAAE